MTTPAQVAKGETAQIVWALHQALHRLANQDGSADHLDYVQSLSRTARGALQRIFIAVTREEAAVSAVMKACNKIGGTDDDLHFYALLWIGDSCEGAIQELLQIAAMWQKISNDALACGGISGSLIQHQCLQQRRRVTKLALGIMDKQLEAQREQGEVQP